MLECLMKIRSLFSFKKNNTFTASGGSTAQSSTSGNNSVTTYNGDINIAVPDNSKGRPSDSPLSKVAQYINDNEYEKNEMCSNCRVVTRLSFSEPREIGGRYEIKAAICLSCHHLIVECREYKVDSKKDFFGKLISTKKHGKWCKMNKSL